MAGTAHSLAAINFISVLLVLTIAVSVIQGMARGASGSAKHLLHILTEGAVSIGSLYLAWQGVQLLSPLLQSWLTAQNIQIPAERMGFFRQMYYTFVTGIRDFPLLRFGVLFLVGYVLLKQLLYLIIDPLVDGWLSSRTMRGFREPPSVLSAAAGGAIGSLMGVARALMIVAVLFIFATLFPHSPMTGYIQHSQLYQKGAKEVIEPVTGDFFANKLPVFTRAVEQEFNNILQRKYEVIDANIPNNIADAAKEITAGAKTDEEKARLLYNWVGKRIQYDWDKVKLYEEQNIWKEQTPEDTFRTRKGVCIDFARLYSVMARSVGLDVKVVTGLGYDGQGGYGPHAWNEVYLSEQKKWVPLDSTWVASGGNWFNPPNFDRTHIKEA
jgi:uncharacterized membrane protein required for colicin V production